MSDFRAHKKTTEHQEQAREKSKSTKKRAKQVQQEKGIDFIYEG